MNKKYYLALVATAALFAGCSSDDNFADESRMASVNDGDRAAIQLQIGELKGTRGTGTVGGLNGADDNYWGGQTFKVSMFDKGTLDYALSNPADATSFIYKNATFTTPNVIGGVPEDNNIARVVTESHDGSLQIIESVSYFPQEGNFDFWAYRLDDAEDSEPAVNGAGDALEAGFTINGSQDIMVAKAIPTMDPNADGSYTSGSWTVPGNRVFSAYSVRRGVTPMLTFDHLLTRLQFRVKASQKLSITAADVNAPTAGEIAASPNAVRVTAIKVRSLRTGKLVTAYTSATAPKRISWTAGSEDFLSLKQRGKELTEPAEYVFTTDMTTGANDALHEWADGQNHGGVAGYSRNDNPPVYDANTTAADGTPNGNAYASVTAALAGGATHIYAAYKVDDAHYGAPDVSKPLDPLTAVTPLWDNSTGTPVEYATPVGEALLVAPQPKGEEGYQLTIEMAQNVSDSRTIDYYNLVDERNGITYYFATPGALDAAKGLYNAIATAETTWNTARANYSEDSSVGGGQYSIEDAYNTKTYYFADAAALAAAQALYDAIGTAITAWNTARAEYKTAPVVEYADPVEKTSSKTITLTGKATPSAFGTDYAPFEAGKNYIVTITLNGLEDVQAGSVPGGFTEGDNLDIQLDE